MMIKRAVIAIFLATTVLLACNAGGKTEQAGKTDEIQSPSPKNGGDPDISYAFGVALGSDLKQTGLEFNYDEMVKGFKDSFEGNERIPLETAIEIIQTAYKAAMEGQMQQMKQEGTTFLLENGQKPGVITTSSGLQYEVLREGTGGKPSASDTVEVHYEGTFLDGSVFDSSYARGEPVKFALDGMIPGWIEGLQLMAPGSSYRFVIPYNLAYGEEGIPNLMPPYATLIFKVELLSIVKK